MEPSTHGLLAETDGTQPPAPKSESMPVPATSADTDGARRSGDAGKIRLPGGQLVSRPVTQPNTDLYERLRRLHPHLIQADGTPSYVPLLLTSAVYSILPPEGTPLTHAVQLSTRLGCHVSLKREDLTPVFSFKIRGAFNLMKQLTGDERWRGVVACSAGNHAQGVAIAGRELGIPCTIVMPLNTPSIKYRNVARMGAKVVLHGADFDEAKRECARLAHAHGLTNIPPFDDPYVIAGQGTVAVEIMRQVDDVNALDAIFVSVGGGGLLAGMLAYIKQIAPPHVKVIGVETYDADALTQSLARGHRVTLDEVGLFADGTAVKIMGEETFRVCADLVDELILVSTDEVCAAIKDVFEDTRSIAEPSGALAIAGMKRYIHDHGLVGTGKRFVGIVSGANINFSRLRFIAERADVGEGNEVMLRVVIPERPGAFLALHDHIHPRAVTEFVYRYSSPTRAHILLSFYLSTPSVSEAAQKQQQQDGARRLSPQERRRQELQGVMDGMQQSGMSALDISDNELAKAHARYLVGGRSDVPNERLYRFEFPERPGALRKFLETLGQRGGENAGVFNISLFHYRNQGGDIAKILCGIQVPQDDKHAFDDWLADLGYPHVDETDNAVYRDFLEEKA